MDLKEMLESGYSVEQLRKEFEDELEDAQEQLKQEKAKKTIDEKELKDAREYLIDVLLDYVAALGILDDDDRDNEDLYNKVEEEFKKYEQVIKEFVDLWNKMKVTKTTRHIDPDTIIKTFIATL